MKTKRNAKFVKDIGGFTGSAKLYRVSPPVTFSNGTENRKTNYIVVSATVAMFSGPETYLFPADNNGKVLGWEELDGSYRGGMDHQMAIDGWVNHQ